MATSQQKLAFLRSYNRSVLEGDPALAEESLDRQHTTEAAFEEMSDEDAEQQIAEESIVMRRDRPVLAIKKNVTELKFVSEAESAIWRDRLKNAEEALARAIPAVGRINLQGGEMDWAGTGWLVADNIIVTNRHVAGLFAIRKGEGFTFAIGAGRPVGAELDFLQEIGSANQVIFKLKRPLHIEASPGPDVAFFEIDTISGDAKLARPITLATGIKETPAVATIGYPAYDSRIPEPELMERIYGKTYNKKRLAPGGITRVEAQRLWHNCTTLGGNSGSAVVSLENGEALGLHFSGSFLKTNYAVRADIVKQILDRVRSGRSARRSEQPAPAAAEPQSPAVSSPRTATGGSLRVAPGGTTTLSIPLTLNVTVSLDMPSAGRARPSPINLSAPGSSESEYLLDEEEARPSDYNDREGYDEGFLGSKTKVPLPEVTRNASDVLEFEDRGKTETVLRYQHFSVVMSRGRRMCFLSACNIDGENSRKNPRVGWKWDPRIPKEQQIMKECYGDPPKFSRGHMTRREDPGWGPKAAAKRGTDDSMHVTNAVPQMQAFNSPIWLALEDYALQHARQDDMKISVFTGPYFTKKDPERYGVLVPRSFWKIIAFIHDETGELCATGYEMSQEANLPSEEEFVFGAFTSPQLGIATQVPISRIERKSGIGFGKLAHIDPLAGDTESVAADALPSALMGLEQIRFIA